MDPEGVANRVESFRNIQKVQPLNLSESDSQLLKQVNEVRYIIHHLAGETVPLCFQYLPGNVGLTVCLTLRLKERSVVFT